MKLDLLDDEVGWLYAQLKAIADGAAARIQASPQYSSINEAFCSESAFAWSIIEKLVAQWRKEEFEAGKHPYNPGDDGKLMKEHRPIPLELRESEWKK